MASLDDYSDSKDNSDLVQRVTDFVRDNIVISVMFGIGCISILLGGLLFIVIDYESNDVEILGVASESETSGIIAEVSGAVVTSGVYELPKGSRVYDLLELADGFSDDVDSNWVDKYLNSARPVEDGEKLFIPSVGDQSTGESAREIGVDQSISSGNYAVNEKTVNINDSSVSELESLWGIGRITAQNIVDQRPYSRIEELRENKILKENVYERNKDLLSVY